MTLYELIVKTQSDFDTYDTVYDAKVTACYIVEPLEDNYSEFCMELIKKVEVDNFNARYASATCKWTDLITKNMDVFREFTNMHWHDEAQYEDDEDEFVYQWINEIDSYMAGGVSQLFYGVLIEQLVNNLK